MPRGFLKLENIEFTAILGVLPEERLASRIVKLDIECAGEWSAGAPPLIDYLETVDILASLAGKEYGLLEELVSEVLTALGRLRPDLEWTVTATKPFPSLKLRTDRAVFTGSNG